MPPFTEQNNMPTTQPRNKKKIVIIIAAVVVVVVLAAGGGWFWWSLYQAEQVKQVAVGKSNTIADSTLKAQQDVRSQAYDVPAYDSSAEQTFKSLRGKAITAWAGEDWAVAIQYSKESLAVKGYENDTGTLTRLAESYGKSNQRDNQVQALQQLKTVYETQKMTDTDEYKAVVEALK